MLDITSVRRRARRCDDDVPNNVCYDWGHGDKAAVDAPFAKAAHVTRLELRQQPADPERDGAARANADYTRTTASTRCTTSQPEPARRAAADAPSCSACRVKVRVIAPDVGGGFGSKIFLYPEDVALVWASKVGRPVKWTAERSESFLTDAHGRDHQHRRAGDGQAQGNFLALRVSTVANMGAYLSTFASAVPTILCATLLAGQYRRRRSMPRSGGVHQHRAGGRLPRAPGGPRRPIRRAHRRDRRRAR